ncbi:alanine racemase [Nocardia africana]|nr:alanine racemase [Nocardia africana]MCC3313696.1 alanine racemase [Nocardia africana]
MVIDLDAITHNVGVLRERAGQASIMAVVKADGYNHGAVPVAWAALRAGATELGVTSVTEALALRGAGITAPILAWLHTPDADFDSALTAGVELAVASPRHLASICAAVRRTGITATVSVKIDTGLNRNGVAAHEYEQLLADLSRADAADAVRFRGLFTHLSHADEPCHPSIEVQRERLTAAESQARRRRLRPEIVHISNSAATLTRPDLTFDMVRPGIAMYGLSPFPRMGSFGLRPAMTVRTQVALVKRISAGEGVSYGHRWTAAEDTTIALLPIGYADGLPRALSGRFDAQIGSRRYPSVGRVCMDQTVIELGPRSDVREGDTAVLLGPGNNGEPTAQSWADVLDTIHYEIVTGIWGRVQRKYVGNNDHLRID